MDSDHVRKYRTSTLGSSLAEALQDLIDEERLTKKDAQTIFGVFDKVRPMSLVRNGCVYMLSTFFYWTY